jgi:hypothetical protein
MRPKECAMRMPMSAFFSLETTWAIRSIGAAELDRGLQAEEAAEAGVNACGRTKIARCGKSNVGSCRAAKNGEPQGLRRGWTSLRVREPSDGKERQEEQQSSHRRSQSRSFQVQELRR